MSEEKETKKYKKINPKVVYVAGGTVLGILLASTVALGVKNIKMNKQISSFQIKENDEFTVTYLADNKVVYTENVKKNEDVKNVPAVPEVKGNDVSWSSDGKNIQENTVISTVLTTKTYNITYLTNIVETGKLNLQIKGEKIDIKDYQNNGYIQYNYYLDFDGENFVYEDINYHFNADYSHVLDDDELDCSVYDNCFNIRNGYFKISDDHTRLLINGSTYCDNKGLFTVYGKFYRIDYLNNQVFNVTDKKVDSTEFIFEDAGGNFKYNPVTGVVTFTDESETTVANRKFVKESITYQFDINCYTYYMIGEDKVKYKTGFSAPEKVTYTYGEDLYFPTEMLKLKTIQTNGFEITKQEDEQTDDNGWRTVLNLNVIFLEENGTKGTVEGGITIYNPIGDIIIYPSFSYLSV